MVRLRRRFPPSPPAALFRSAPCLERADRHVLPRRAVGAVALLHLESAAGVLEGAAVDGIGAVHGNAAARERRLIVFDVLREIRLSGWDRTRRAAADVLGGDRHILLGPAVDAAVLLPLERALRVLEGALRDPIAARHAAAPPALPRHLAGGAPPCAYLARPPPR